MKRKLLNIREFYFVPCPTYSTDSATPHPTPPRGATFSQDPGEGIVRLRRTVDSASSAYASVFLRKTVRLDGIGQYPIICSANKAQCYNSVGQKGIFY